MSDARLNPEAPPSPEHALVRRQDYRPPDWWVSDVALDVDLDPAATRVRSVLKVERNGSHDRTIRLSGDGLRPLAVTVDGQEARWTMEGGDLVVAVSGNTAEIATEVVIAPAENSQLIGLYASGGLLCTQCEAEGFRRITFHPDRPDVLSVYRVRMTADKVRYPVLLANGNPVASGDLEGGRHWTEWHDPFPKPSYLFAMVAGDLEVLRDTFTTMNGREVELGIWVRAKDLPKTHHAMASLKQAMAWDEQVYGREYDLDRFNIVAVDDFNFGAMENKGLNIFNSRYVLADTETATDADFDAIAGVVAHEYFHNWSGNRVTCRDWFQLSLKEGFTVFRDQSFSADIGSEAVKRIDDVRLLRAVQFPEDSGPLAHPVRPDSYLEIGNFYTATIYNKGAELIRMMRTMMGAEAFRRGTDLYFDRHDGEAATCDDFVAAMEEASGLDLGQFKLWYEQAGTPQVAARVEPEDGGVTLHLSQSVPPTPDQPVKQPMVVPLRTRLIDVDGSGGEERLIVLDRAEHSVRIDGASDSALLSINRGFSAPVALTVERRPGELESLATSDDDPFARYEALQELAYRVLVGGGAPDPLVEAIGATLRSNALDSAFKGEALTLPSEAMVAERFDRADPDAIHATREALRRAIGTALGNELAEAQAATSTGSDLSPQAKGVRRLRTIALSLLSAGDPDRGAALAKAQYDQADNMTDRQGALAVLSMLDAPSREEAFADFYRRYREDSLVIDKWFALQASAPRSDALDMVEALRGHADFTMKNPNRLRALAGGLAANHWRFHSPDGRGYQMLADFVIEADSINPQVAARLVPPLGRWRRLEQGRSSLMKAELERIVAAPGLSKDTFEQASKSLA
ncbi:aminopeptidase N [Sphingomonas sp. HDW15A]|uniref:aminopeptidase N n=1 Tax=Sphingomonas sp. HDW15A TaxID=2714942 RepID=UPI00140DCA28|nr:aminopeptidase N [Sphingomonas sp. HDW15A]QIK96783.1 aminopeptidase N [Sphingomonas sp. HDW15A]